MAIRKVGRKSQAANDFLQPKAPLSPVATNVGTSRPYNNGSASVAFTPDTSGAAATSFTVTSSPGGYTATGASSPIVVTGLQSATAYTFTVTGTNAVGTGNASVASASITATTVPQAPISPSAVSTVANQDSVSWSAPATGGSAITSYTIVSSDTVQSPTRTNATSPSVFTEVANTSQNYSIYAINANGTSLAAVTATITTLAPFFPPSFFSPPAFFAPPGFFSPPGFFAPPGFFNPPGFFAPPVFFSPPFFCIDQDTLIAVIGLDGTVSWKMAKHLLVGDAIWAANWNELIDEASSDPYTWTAPALTDIALKPTYVTNIIESKKDITVYFNKNENERFSLEQTILVKRGNTWMFITTGTVEVGDSLMKFNNDTHAFYEDVVVYIDTIDEERSVYQVDALPVDIIIAGGLVVHNKKGF